MTTQTMQIPAAARTAHTTHALNAGDNPAALLQREWLLTNATGAFALGNAMACPTRKYHGMLVAASKPPVIRVLALNNVWEQLTLGPTADFAQPEQTLEFANLQFLNDQNQPVFAPAGHTMLTGFTRGLAVAWHYETPQVRFTRQLTLHWHEQAITLRYLIEPLGDEPAELPLTLRLHPMLALRDFHAITRHAHDAGFHFESDGQNRLTVRRNDLATTFQLTTPDLPTPQTRFEAGEHWWFNIHYPLEAQRGQEAHEDLYVPGCLAIDLRDQPSYQVHLTAALGEHPAPAQPEPVRRATHLQPIAQHLRDQLPSDLPLNTPAPAKPQRKKKSTRKTQAASDPQSVAELLPIAPPLTEMLAIAADDFIVTRQAGERTFSTIIAGYPWFTDWGRDTFIALPGLLLATGRHDEARDVLAAFAAHLHHGMIPNRFDDYDDNAAHYNTVDASLWFVHAAVQYVNAAGDSKAWRDWLADACIDILEHYSTGTNPPDGPADPDTPLIRMDEDGLIAAGHDRTQLTWMDAACHGQVFTPRPGKCVEINALWYNALCCTAEQLDTLRDKTRRQHAERYMTLARKVKRSFNATFWRDELGYCLDYVHTDPQGRTHEDTALRPNQLLAISLPHSPLAQAKQKKALAAVREKLLTPVGLRTLAPDHPDYQPHYAGDAFHRDRAYHNGTVWPWLIGPYAEAILRTGKHSRKAKQEARQALEPLIENLTANAQAAEAADSQGAPTASLGSIGQLHEIYQPEPDPDTGRHQPAGCPAQAWSIAELLRVLTQLT